MAEGSRTLYYIPPWTRHPDAGGRLLLRPEAAEAAPVETDALTVHVLSQCTGARTLDEHAARILQVCSADPKTVQALLDALQACGLLRRLSTGTSDAPDDPACVSVVGIPTADRPEVATAALRDALDHVERRGSEVCIFVLDGSSSAERQALTQRVVQGTAASRARYIGPRHRMAVVNRLSAMGFNPDLLRSAVGAGNIGSQRNLLLLLSAGRALLMADDDIRWTTWRPRSCQPGLRLGGHAEHREHRFFATRAAALSDIDAEPADLLTLHEGVLGRSLLNLVGEETDIASACSHVLDLLNARHPARVRVTMAGLAGDSGTYCPYLRLLSDGTLRAALSDDESFALAFSSREVQRVAPRTTIGDEPRCMAGCMAADNREVLPPFMWHGGNEDGIFGVMLAALDRGALFGHLAAGVVHDTQRPSARDEGRILSAVQTRMADLLLAAIPPRSGIRSHDLQSRLGCIANGFRQAAELPLDEFQELVRFRLVEARRRQLARLESIGDNDGYPVYWRAAAIRFRNECLASMKEPAFFCPIEFRRRECSLDGCFSATRAAVGEFAEFLQVWPDLWAAARRLGGTLLES